MDEAMLKMLVELGAIPEEQALLMRQADQGQAMFQTPGAGGMRVGGTYQAAHPLEHLSVALQRAMGANRQTEAEQGFKQTLGRQTQGRTSYAEALMRLLNGDQGGGAANAMNSDMYGF